MARKKKQVTELLPDTNVTDVTEVNYSYNVNSIERTGESILAIYWKETTMSISLIGDFPRILDFVEYKTQTEMNANELFNLVMELNMHTNLTILINGDEYKTGFSGFIEQMDLYFGHIPIKRLKGKFNTGDELLDVFILRLSSEWLEGKAYISITDK